MGTYIGINAFKIICFVLYANYYCVIGFYFELPQTGITVDEDVGIVELCVNYSEADNLPLNVSATIYGGKVFNYLQNYMCLFYISTLTSVKINDYILSKQCSPKACKMYDWKYIMMLCP